MLGNEKPETANLQEDYALHSDFCEVFEKNMQSLYLLAFLLTANHQEAEQCFVSTVEEAFKGQAVFKGWVRSWVKRCLIKSAIHIVFSASARNAKRDLWEATRHETQRYDVIDAVTNLAPLERFVFVMSILEQYSAWDCSLLLGCSINKVAAARVRALHRLPERDAIFLGVESLSTRLEVTA
jgi:DNA-directed RNA polymerase specialized sigma24 family protein